MKLSYRGVNYELTPPTLEVTEGEILGQYRGVSWCCQTLREIPVPHSSATLTYRGVTYNREQGTVQATSRTAWGAATKPDRPVSIPKAFPVRKQSERVHRANLLRNLDRRIQVAKERGDQNLIDLLEAESRQLGSCRDFELLPIDSSSNASSQSSAAKDELGLTHFDANLGGLSQVLG